MFYIECKFYYYAQFNTHFKDVSILETYATREEAVEALKGLLDSYSKYCLRDYHFFQYSGNEISSALMFTGKFHKYKRSNEYFEDYYRFKICFTLSAGGITAHRRRGILTS